MEPLSAAARAGPLPAFDLTSLSNFIRRLVVCSSDPDRRAQFESTCRVVLGFRIKDTPGTCRIVPVVIYRYPCSHTPICRYERSTEISWESPRNDDKRLLDCKSGLILPVRGLSDLKCTEIVYVISKPSCRVGYTRRRYIGTHLTPSDCCRTTAMKAS